MNWEETEKLLCEEVFEKPDSDVECNYYDSAEMYRIDKEIVVQKNYQTVKYQNKYYVVRCK